MGSDSNHKICQAISGISLPLGSDKLYSGSADGSVRIWDCNSGKVAWFSAHSNVSDYALMNGLQHSLIMHGLPTISLIMHG